MAPARHEEAISHIQDVSLHFWEASTHAREVAVHEAEAGVQAREAAVRGAERILYANQATFCSLRTKRVPCGSRRGFNARYLRAPFRIQIPLTAFASPARQSFVLRQTNLCRQNICRAAPSYLYKSCRLFAISHQVQAWCAVMSCTSITRDDRVRKAESQGCICLVPSRIECFKQRITRLLR